MLSLIPLSLNSLITGPVNTPFEFTTGILHKHFTPRINFVSLFKHVFKIVAKTSKK